MSRNGGSIGLGKSAVTCVNPALILIPSSGNHDPAACLVSCRRPVRSPASSAEATHGPMLTVKTTHKAARIPRYAPGPMDVRWLCAWIGSSWGMG